MKKEDFDLMERTDQWSHLSTHIEDLKSSVRNRIGILPQMSVLSATLIIVATLNKELVPINEVETKTILLIFLWLIPLTLHIYVHDLSVAEKKIIKSIGDCLGQDISHGITKKQTFSNKAIAYAPKIVICIFYFIIFYLTLKIF